MAGRRYIAVQRFNFQKCNEKNFLLRKLAGDSLWNAVRTEVVRYTTLQGFQAKFNCHWNGLYQTFHTCLDTLIMDVPKKAAETRRNGGLNPDPAGEEEVASDGDASRDERAIARHQLTIDKEKPV